MALVVVLAALAGCSGSSAASPAPPTSSPAVAQGWEGIADGPLSARNGATAVWTGREVLVFGGDRSYCPPGVTCELVLGPAMRDGAAYDPAADSWRRIAAAPVAIRSASIALVGQTLYALVRRSHPKEKTRFLAYDLAADKWKRLPAPDSSVYSVAAVGDLVIASRQYTLAGVDDWYWDPAARAWRDLPDSPKMPWDLRQLVDVGGVGILVGQGRIQGSRRDQGYLAALRLDPKTRTWSRLSSPKQERRPSVIGTPWFVVDGLAVSASTHGDRYGNSGLLGGFLDPEHGWSPLPARPRTLDRSEEHLYWAEAAGGGRASGRTSPSCRS